MQFQRCPESLSITYGPYCVVLEHVVDDDTE